MPLSTITIRNAAPGDIRPVCRLLQAPAEAGEILPRTEDDIRQLQNERHLLVAAVDNAVAGTVSLRDYGDGLYEIRSLVVADAYRGQRVGSRMVEAAVQLAREKGGHSVFALTYHPRLFERQGFERVSKTRFPQKVWQDCSRCPKREHCDEIALVWEAPPRK